jgi:uncharacterized membrane protein YhaH (DUF805 family)
MAKLKQHLLKFLKSRTIFNGYIFKNRFLLLSLFFLIVITFIFNNSIQYFKDINIHDYNLLNMLLIFVMIYLTFIKFNILVRVVSIFKSIIFFYKSNKLNKIKDLKIIA